MLFRPEGPYQILLAVEGLTPAFNGSKALLAFRLQQEAANLLLALAKCTGRGRQAEGDVLPPGWTNLYVRFQSLCPPGQIQIFACLRQRKVNRDESRPAPTPLSFQTALPAPRVTRKPIPCALTLFLRLRQRTTARSRRVEMGATPLFRAHPGEVQPVGAE